MPTRTLELEWPSGGIDKRLSIQKQKPFTTPFCKNVRPFDPLEQRRRGGSRPDLVKAFTQQLGSGAKVNLLDSMRSTSAPTLLTFNDALGDASNWDAASWATASADFTTEPGKALAIPVNGVYGNVLNSASALTLSTTTTRTLWAYVTVQDEIAGIRLYGNMDNSAPSQNNSVYASIQRAGIGEEYELEIRTVENRVTVLTATDATDFSGVQSGWLSLTISEESAVARFFGPSTLEASVSGTIPVAGAGGGCGFVMDWIDGSVGNIHSISHFTVNYYSASVSPSELVVAAAGGTLYREIPSGTMAAVANASTTVNTVVYPMTLATSPIESVSRRGVLYIADFADPRVEETSDEAGVMTSPTVDGIVHTRWTPDSEADFENKGIIVGGDVIEITSQTGGTIVLDWYKINGVDTATRSYIDLVNLDGTAITQDNNTAAMQYRIIPGLKTYTVATDTLALWVAAGTVTLPYGCRHIAKHLDRVVLSGDPNNDSTVYFSRQGGPSDFLEVPTDVESAYFTGSTDGLAQDIGAPVRGIYAHSRDYFVINTSQDIWLIRGDLRQGGSMTRLSGSVGMISGRAFNIDDNGIVLFLARNGIYSFSPQSISNSQNPEKVSKERVPQELRGVDPDVFSVTMGNNPDEGGTYLWITPLDAGASTEYFFELESGSFSPDSLTSDHQVFCSTYFGRTNEMLVGCRDGYIRKYDPDGIGDDDGTARTQEVDYGPIPLNRGRAAVAESIEITLDEDSSDVAWSFRAGQSPEEAFNATARVSGTAVGGINYLQPVRDFGQWGFLRLSTTTAARWAVEGIKLTVLPAAEQRKF